MLSRLALNLRPTFLTSASTAARAFSSTTPTVHQGTVRAFDSRRVSVLSYSVEMMDVIDASGCAWLVRGWVVVN